MKHKRRTVVLLVALMVVCMLCTTLTACNKDSHQINDPETRPFAMAISAPDEVFNPFFYTSGNDAEIISLTQISMINTDVNGEPVVGDNEPTVVKAYTTETKKETIGGTERDITTYKFLIKNGIKWADGSALTIHDVLFNLYVYLDPVYTGSATIYSTDIVGLQAYRQQDPDKADSSDSGSGNDNRFIAVADQRIENIIDLVRDYSTYIGVADKPTLPADFDEEQGLLDIAYVAKSFYEELLRDWRGTNKEDYKDWGFTEKWQVFMFNDAGNMNFLERENPLDPGSAFLKDDNGNYKLNETYSDEFFNREGGLGEYLFDKGFATDVDGKYVIIPQVGEENQKKLDDAIGEFCVEYAFKGKFYSTFPMGLLKRTESRVSFEDNEKAELESALLSTDPDDFEEVVRYWGTAATVLDRFTAEAKTAEFKKNGGKLVKNISGITAYTVKQFKDMHFSEDHYVLQIKIFDVDPKAILNFGFTVAPMYYYSTDSWSSTGNSKDNKNYIDAAMRNQLGDNDNGEYGVEFG
ncbi:MAG: hypothetical protein K2N18_01175, partial [Clostridia bacterium]|nr:hypothetical protein [Clostridia bacterium]